MTTLYIDRKDLECRLDGEAIAYYIDNQRQGTVPLAPLSRIFIRGHNTVETRLLGKLGEKGIGLVVLSGRFGRATLFLPNAHKDAMRRLKQYAKANDTDECLRLARDQVRRKIGSEINFLKDIASNPLHRSNLIARSLNQLRRQLLCLDEHTELNAVRGAEGAAAKEYFAAFSTVFPPSLEFKERNRRPPRDPVNAALSLGYTLLYAEAVLGLHRHGLDPAIGFLHEPEFGRESLACDVIEPLRVEVDRYVWDVFREQELRSEHFTVTTDGCLMGKAGRLRFYETFDERMRSIRESLNESIEAFLCELT